MSLSYGNDVRLSNSSKVTFAEDDGRMISTYFFVYGSLTIGERKNPKSIDGYPYRAINVDLDDESYIVIRSLVADSEQYDLSGVVIRPNLDLISRSALSGVPFGGALLPDINLDDVSVNNDYGKVWQLGRKYVLGDVVSNIDVANASDLIVSLGMLSKDISGNIGNEWGVSVLLNSPAPTDDF